MGLERFGTIAILMTSPLKVGVIGSLMLIGVALNSSVSLAQPTSTYLIAPHRAVYEISLLRASPGAGIADMNGRMVYEVSGGSCAGYSQKMRFVTRISDHDGSVHINDLRSKSWESGKGERLKFSLTQFRDDNLTDATEGKAGRPGSGGAVKVELTKPRRKGLKIDGGVYFPMQHTLALIEAAGSGQRSLIASVYDGSDNGAKVYLTNAIIGKELTRGTAQLPKELSSDVRPLAQMRAWPVSISYFEPTAKANSDSVPSYEISFQFLENGISTRLSIDYGDFALRGNLKEVTLLDLDRCDKGRENSKANDRPR